MKQKKSLLTQAVLASTLFCLLPPLSHAQTGISGDTTATAGGSYIFGANGITLTVPASPVITLGTYSSNISIDTEFNILPCIGSCTNETVLFLGSATVPGSIGPSNPVNLLSIQGGAGTTVYLESDVHLGNSGNLGSNSVGEIQFNTTATPTSVVEFAPGVTVQGYVDNTLSGSNGVLQLDGGFNITGQNGNSNYTIGNTFPLSAINLIGPNSQVFLFTGGPSSSINVGSINFASGTLSSNSSTSTANDDTELFFSPAATITGNIYNTTGNAYAGDVFFSTGTSSVSGSVGSPTMSLNEIAMQAKGSSVTLGTNSSNTTAAYFILIGEAGSNGVTTTLTGPVTAQEVDITGPSTSATFNSTLSTNTLNVGDSDVDTLTANFDGAVTATGTITIYAGATNTFSSSVGASTINLSGNGVIGNFDGTVNATNFNFQGVGDVAEFAQSVTGAINFTNGADDAGYANFFSGANLTGSINNTSGTANIGTAYFGGANTVSGTVGVTGKPLFQVIMQGANSTVTFQSAVDSDLVSVTAPGGTATFQGTLTTTDLLLEAAGAAANFQKAVAGGTLFFNPGSTTTTSMNFSSNATLTGSIINDSGTADIGTVNFAGPSSVSGSVGVGDSGAVYAVNLNGTGLVTFTGGVAAEAINLVASGAIGTFNSTVNAPINIEASGATVNLNTGSSLTGNITFLDTADTTSAVNVADGVNITGAINNTEGATPVGVVNFAGTSTVSAAIGATHPIYQLNLNGGSTKTVTFDNTVDAANINIASNALFDLALTDTSSIITISGTGVTSTFDEGVSAASITISGSNAIGNFNVIGGTTTVGNNITISGPSATGTFHGATSASKILVSGSSATGTFDSTTAVDTIDVSGPSASATFVGAVSGDTGTTINILNEGAAATAVFENTVATVSSLVFDNNANTASMVTFDKSTTVNSIDSTTNPDVGIVLFNAGGTVGTIGTTKQVYKIELGGGTTEFQDNINAATLLFVGPSAATATIDTGVNILGNVDSTLAGNNLGTLNFNGTSTVDGTIGATYNLAAVNLQAGSNVTFDSTIGILAQIPTNNTSITFNGAGATATFANNANIYGNINSTSGNGGTLNFQGNSTVAGTTGTAGSANALTLININGGPSTQVNLNGTINAFSPIDINNGGTVNISKGQTVLSIDNTMSRVAGTVIFQGGGSSSVGNIGGTSPLALVSVNPNGQPTTLTFTGSMVSVDNINVAGAGGTTLDFNNGSGTTAEYNNITTVNNGLDNIVLSSNGSSIIDGNIGTTNNPFNSLTMPTAGTTWEVVGDIHANSIVFQNTGQTLAIGAGFSAFGPITTLNNNQGTVQYLGSSIVNYPIGASGKAVGTVNVHGPAGSVVNLNAPVFTNAFTADNGGTLVPMGGAGAVLTSTTPVTFTNNSVLAVPNKATFNINGGLTLNNATLQVDMAYGLTAGETVATGPIHFNSGKVLLLNAGFVPGETTTVPVMQGGAGTSYTLNAITLETRNPLLTKFSLSVTGGGDILNVVTESAPASQFATQPNTMGVAGALDAIAEAGNAIGSLAEIIQQLNTFETVEELDFALATLAPIVDGGILNESFMAQREIFDAIGQRFDRLHWWHKHHGNGNPIGFSSGDGNDDKSAWVKVLRQHANQKERQGVEGYHEDMLGLVVGGDTFVRDELMVGAAFSWTNLDIHDKLVNRFKTTANSYQATVYASFECNTPWFYEGYAALAYNDYIAHRNILFGDVDLFPRGQFYGMQFGAKAKAGYIFDFDSVHVVPVATLFYSNLSLDPYEETGADSANQRIQGSTFNALLGGVGVQLVDDYAYDTQRLFQAEVHGMAYYDFIGDKMALTSQFVGAGPSFITNGFTPAKASFNIGGNFSLFSTHDWIYTVSYDFDVKEDYTASAGFLRIRHEW